MPMYQCMTPAGTVPDAVRPQIATEITRLHVEATNAPPSFVHVIILDVPPGAHYTAGKPDTHTTLISGTVRAGRSSSFRYAARGDAGLFPGTSGRKPGKKTSRAARAHGSSYRRH